MRRQHDRLLMAQQSRQHRPPAGHQGSREIGGEQRQRARQDIRQNQIIAVPAQPATAKSGSVSDPHPAGNAVVRDIMAGDRDRVRIDVARANPAPQQLGGGDRQDAGAGADIERTVDPTPAHQSLECDQAALGRRMLAGAESGCSIEHDPDRPGRHPAPMMRAIDEKPADRQWRECQLVLREPVAVGESPRRPRSAHRRQRRPRAPAAPTAPGSAPRISDRLRAATPRARSRTPKRRLRSHLISRTRPAPPRRRGDGRGDDGCRPSPNASPGR